MLSQGSYILELKSKPPTNSHVVDYIPEPFFGAYPRIFFAYLVFVVSFYIKN